MTPRDVHDPRLDELARLTPLAQDPARAERVRLRCRAQLVRQADRAARTETIVGSAARVLVPALLGAFSALYAAALVGTTLRVVGFLR